MTQADPMNDPSTELEIPPCAICTQPGKGAWIHNGVGKTHCEHTDCESKVHQLANPDAIHWNFDEPWPPARKEDAPVPSVGGGDVAPTSAGAAPPARPSMTALGPVLEHPRWKREHAMLKPKAALSPANLPPADLAAARLELQEAFRIVLTGDGSGIDVEISARLADLLMALRTEHEILMGGVEVLRRGHSILEAFAWLLSHSEELQSCNQAANVLLAEVRRLTSG